MRRYLIKPALKKNKYISRSKGYTAVEVVIILVIIAILAAISIPAFMSYVSDATDRSREKETAAVAEAAEIAVDKVYKLGTPIDEINSDSKAARNLRDRILNTAGASGKIVSFHVSSGEFYNHISEKAAGKPAPKDLDFTKAGTVEFLEYEGEDGKWYGQYRVLPDYSSQVRMVDYPQFGSKVTVNND